MEKVEEEMKLDKEKDEVNEEESLLDDLYNPMDSPTSQRRSGRWNINCIRNIKITLNINEEG